MNLCRTMAAAAALVVAGLANATTLSYFGSGFNPGSLGINNNSSVWNATTKNFAGSGAGAEEFRLNTGSGGGVGQTLGQMTWGNGFAHEFKLSYSTASGGSATFAIKNTSGAWVTISRTGVGTTFNTIQLFVRAGSNTITTSMTASITNLMFNSQSLGTFSQFANGAQAQDAYWFGSAGNMGAADFEMTGFYNVAWTGGNGLGNEGARIGLIFGQSELTIIPVPAPVALAGLGLIGIAGLRRRFAK